MFSNTPLLTQALHYAVEEYKDKIMNSDSPHYLKEMFSAIEKPKIQTNISATENKIQQIQSSIEQYKAQVNNSILKKDIYFYISQNYSELYDLTHDKAIHSKGLIYYKLSRAIETCELKQYQETKTYINSVKKLLDPGEFNTNEKTIAYDAIEELSQNLALSGESSDSDRSSSDSD